MIINQQALTLGHLVLHLFVLRKTWKVKKKKKELPFLNEENNDLVC